jgi:hypothetical protein
VRQTVVEVLAKLSRRSQVSPGEPHALGRWVPNRIRPLFKDVSTQLQRVSGDGTPTLLAVYDATPFQLYSDDLDVLQAMFGRLSVDVWIIKPARQGTLRLTTAVIAA